MPSIEDVRIALNLKTWDQIFVEGIRKTCDMGNELGYSEITKRISERRGTGRTTKFLVGVVAQVLTDQERIQIRSWYGPKHEAKLIQQAREWIEQLGGDPYLVIGQTQHYPGRHSELWDHH